MRFPGDWEQVIPRRCQSPDSPCESQLCKKLQPSTGGISKHKISEIGDVGVNVAIDDSATFDGTRAVKITNMDDGGNFAVTVRTILFDTREYPPGQFVYRIPSTFHTNFLVKVRGRWYEIDFTDDGETPKAQASQCRTGDSSRLVDKILWPSLLVDDFERQDKKNFLGRAIGWS